MAMDTFVVLAASYDTLGAAEADYHAVRDFYLVSGVLDTYDAAVITRDDGGKSSSSSTSSRRGRARGAGWVSAWWAARSSPSSRP